MTYQTLVSVNKGDNIKTFTSEDEKQKYLCALVLGEGDSGKTYFAGKGAQQYKTLWITTDPDETITLDTMDNPPKYNCWVIETEDDLITAWKALRKNEAGYELVVVDPANRIQELKKMDILRGSSSKDDFTEKIIKGGIKMQVDGWGELNMSFPMWFRAIKELPLHKIFISHVATDKSFATSESKLYPALEGAFKRTISSIPNCVIYNFLYTDTDGKVYRCFTTKGSEDITAKDRLNFEKLLVNATPQTYIKIMEGGEKPEQSDLEKRIERQLKWNPINKPDIKAKQGG